jgi:ADP-heptose:LPS heptosyltransferase
LKTCVAFVGHDSGISHLAGALSLSGLVLWGETIAEIWSPPNPRLKMIRRAEGLTEIPVEQVARELKNLLAKPDDSLRFEF